MKTRDNQDNFDSLIKLHAEIKSFKTDNSIGILAQFRDATEAKFNKTISEKQKNKTEKNRKARVHLSSTAICSYALAQYANLWNETNQIVFDKEDYFKKLSEYWSYIVKALEVKRTPLDIEALDEFSILNTLSVLKEIKKKICEIEGEKVLDLKNDDTIRKAINALCHQFIDNQFAYVEVPHPFINYKFLTILDDWKEKLDAKELRESLKTKHTLEDKYAVQQENTAENKQDTQQENIKYDKGLFLWFWDTIYNSAKYELYRQVAFYDAKEKTLFDVKRLVYSLLIVSWKNRYSDTLLADRALDIIFKEQLDTGLLPISHVVNNDFVMTPEFESNDVDAVPKEYKILPSDVSASPLLLSFECFTDMLKNERIRKDLGIYQEKLALAYNWANERLRKNHDNEQIGWYPEYESTHEPYSWVASHVLIFLKEYCSFISEIASERARNYFNAKKIDKDITIYDTYKIKEYINAMVGNANYSSALVFGPPGTGKSTIAQYLARELGRKDAEKGQSRDRFESWDYIEIIPGQFLASGKEQIIPKANEIFKRLSRIKKAVVLFDEVDQLVANREAAQKEEKESYKGWIVTALLPKFVDLRNQEGIKFILATNAKLKDVDQAIIRVGRIDLILPMGGVFWKGRIKMLKEAIGKINNNDDLKQKLLDDIFPNKSKFAIYYNGKTNKTKDEYKKAEDEFFEDLTREYIRDNPDLVHLHCFLYRTNHVSQPMLRLLFERIFSNENTKKGNLTKIFHDSEYRELFTHSGLKDYPCDDELFSEFHKQIRDDKCIRLPKVPNMEKLAAIVDNNIYPKDPNAN